MGAFVRDEALHRLATDHFDVVVIGGGVTGAGCALDAASRGLRTALIEREDFASGTSSRSSKMVHGGLRYLQHGSIGLVHEALVERQRLLRNAPHLVEILPFVLPVLAGGGGAVPRGLAPALDAAMWLYDLSGGIRIGRFHGRLDESQTIAHVPTLDPRRLRRSYLYYDAQVDDARLTLTIARTACIAYDAVAANRVAAISLSTNSTGRVDGVVAQRCDGSSTTGTPFRISTDAVVNACGVWADDVDRLAEPSRIRTVRPAKGVHLTVPRARVGNDVAAIFQTRADRRWIFIIPWGEHCFIGTTDTDYDGPLDDPRCTAQDATYLLDAVNAEAGTDLSSDDVTGSWAGLRPLVSETDPRNRRRTVDLSRRHRIDVAHNGVVTVTGGKLTTYRRMAAETIDTVVRRSTGSRRRPRSRTKDLPLIGSEGYRALRIDGVDPSLVARHGNEVHTILSLIDEEPALGAPIVDRLPYLAAELVFAVRHEMATTLDDLLSRRTRARILELDATRAAASAVADLVADDLGWDPAERSRRVEEFLDLTAHDFTGRSPT